MRFLSLEATGPSRSISHFYELSEWRGRHPGSAKESDCHRWHCAAAAQAYLICAIIAFGYGVSMSREFRDNRGKTLADYVRPSVAVDTAVLSVDPDKGLVVLQVHRDTAVGWALPGTFPVGRRNPRRRRATRTIPKPMSGACNHASYVFDRLGRDDRGTGDLSSASCCGPRRPARPPPRDGPVNARPAGRGHNEIITMAVADLRARYTDKPDPDHLLGDRFTRANYARSTKPWPVSRSRPDKIDTFRRKMKLHPDRNPGLRHRRQPRPPARLFQHTPWLTTSPAVGFVGAMALAVTTGRSRLERFADRGAAATWPWAVRPGPSPRRAPRR